MCDDHGIWASESKTEISSKQSAWQHLLCDIDITLGQGAFGKVVRAEAVGIIEAEENTVVAVKMVRGKFLSLWQLMLWTSAVILY